MVDLAPYASYTPLCERQKDTLSVVVIPLLVGLVIAVLLNMNSLRRYLVVGVSVSICAGIVFTVKGLLRNS